MDGVVVAYLASCYRIYRAIRERFEEVGLTRLTSEIDNLGHVLRRRVRPSRLADSITVRPVYEQLRIHGHNDPCDAGMASGLPECKTHFNRTRRLDSGVIVYLFGDFFFRST